MRKRKTNWLRLAILAGTALALSVVAVRKQFPALFIRNGLPVEGGAPLSVRIGVTPYLQWDPRWGGIELGQSGANLGEVGCTVCSTAMALGSQGIRVDPGELNTLLTKYDGYTDSGLLIWRSLETVTDGEFGVQVVDRPTHAYLDQCLNSGNPLVAKVRYFDQVWHWVLITGKEGSAYLMCDPLGSGEPHELMAEYGSGIYAVRHLVRRRDG